MKLYTIYLDGIDKTGKDSILPYIGPVCNYRYVCNIRGVMTQFAYDELYGRDYSYDLDQQKDCLNVLLTVEEEDWKVRCKMTNEPAIDYKKNCEVFERAYNKLESAGCPVIKINTSKHSLYEIAKIIVNEIDHLNGLN